MLLRTLPSFRKQCLLLQLSSQLSPFYSFFFPSNFARKEHIQVKFRNASVRRKIHNTRHFLLRWSKKVIRKFCFEKWEISSRAYLQSKPCISGEKLFDCCQTIIRSYSPVKTRRGKKWQIDTCPFFFLFVFWIPEFKLSSTFF